MEVWKIIFLSTWVMCRFHVNLPECIPSNQVLAGTSAWVFRRPWIVPDRPVDPSFAVVDPLGSIDHRPGAGGAGRGEKNNERPNVGETPGRVC